MSPAATSTLTHRKSHVERQPFSLLLVLDVTYDGFAYMGDKVVERPVFFLARVKFAFENGLRPGFLIRRSISLVPIVFNGLRGWKRKSRLAAALHN